MKGDESYVLSNELFKSGTRNELQFDKMSKAIHAHLIRIHKQTSTLIIEEHCCPIIH